MAASGFDPPCENRVIPIVFEVPERSSGKFVPVGMGAAFRKQQVTKQCPHHFPGVIETIGMARTTRSPFERM
jgi:hypothetical protein